MKLNQFLELCERAARDLELGEVVVGHMGEADYAPVDDLSGDENSHFLWLETLAEYIRLEIQNDQFDFAPSPERDINELSLRELHDLLKNPYVRVKKAFMDA